MQSFIRSGSQVSIDDWPSKIRYRVPQASVVITVEIRVIDSPAFIFSPSEKKAIILNVCLDQLFVIDTFKIIVVAQIAEMHIRILEIMQNESHIFYAVLVIKRNSNRVVLTLPDLIADRFGEL